MNAKFFLPCMAFIGALAMSGMAHAGQQTYSYTVEHPFYGEIGTFINTVHDADGLVQMDSQLRVEIRVLGIAVFQQDADRSEVWRGNQLISFRSVSHKNGERLEVSGEATDKGFVVTSPSGKTLSTANVAPSDPWAIRGLGAAVVVSTESGKIEDIEVSGGEASTVQVQGLSTPVHHFHVRTDTEKDKWEVWLDEHGVPIKFRSIESDTPIDFVLGGSAAPAASVAKYEDATSSPFYVGAR
ncbi:MAG: DUF6134 family protein [Alphaproteobacteria bacterium]